MRLKPHIEDFGPYWVSDTPSTDLTIEFVDEDSQLVDVPPEALSVLIVDPFRGVSEGTIVRTSPGLDEDDEPLPELAAEFVWPEGITLFVPGVWQLVVIAGGMRQTALRFVVQLDDGWHTLESLRDEWLEARQLSDPQLYSILSAARSACEEYAPALAPGQPVPDSWRLAQLMQARALWQSMRANADPSTEGEFAVPTFPMDWTVRGLLRQRSAVPRVS